MYAVFPGRIEFGAMRRLRGHELREVEEHFLALEPEARILRFGSLLQDAGILVYVGKLDFQRDLVLGWPDSDRRLGAVVHLAHITDTLVEFGVSVLAQFRGHGHGQQCTLQALAFATRSGYCRAHVQFVAANHRMRAIMNHFVAHEERDGTEHMVNVALPPVLRKAFLAPLQPFVPVSLAV